MKSHSCPKCGGVLKNPKATQCRSCYSGKILSTVKTCAQCKIEKPLEKFKPRNLYKYGVNSICRECDNTNTRARYWKTPEKFRTRSRTGKLLSKFNLTEEQYKELGDSACHICGALCKTGRRLAVDHCHVTGKIRGLLCANCNRALGMFQDNITIVKAAVSYLELRG